MTFSLVPEKGRVALFPCLATNLVQFQFVTVNSSGQLVMPTAGQACLVLDDAPSLTTPTGAPGATVAGVYYTCVFAGIMKVIAGAALTPFAPVTTDASGHAVGSPTTGQFINGLAMAACGSGDLVPVLLTPGNVHY